MEIQERINILQQIDLFESFDDTELNSLAKDITEIELEPESILVSENSIGQDMFVLFEGSLKITKGKRIITNIKAVDYIGEMALIEEKPRSATVIATSPSKLFKITSNQFEKYFSNQPKSLVSMMKSLSMRIRNNTKIIAGEFEKANILIHDMRNSISSFLLLDLMEDDTEDPNLLHFIKLCRKSRDDLIDMMDEALANAKSIAHYKIKTKSSLGDLINDLVKSINIHDDFKGIKLDAKIDQDIPQFSFYQIGISRVISNLLINAAQASGPGNTISIKLQQSSGQAVVTIIDQGKGIPEPIKHMIFQPQFTTKEKGSGFGLTSCKQIIEELHKGNLSFRTNKDEGTIFTFSIPLFPNDSTS